MAVQNLSLFLFFLFSRSFFSWHYKKVKKVGLLVVIREKAIALLPAVRKPINFNRD